MSTDYPPDWNNRRKEVYQRDGFQCQNCGTTGGLKGGAELHAHHIVPKSKGGTHKKTNLVTVCKRCHKAIHGKAKAPSGNFTIGSSREYLDSVQQVAAPMAKLESVFEDFLLTVKNGEPASSKLTEINQKRAEVVRLAFDVKKEVAKLETSPTPSNVPQGLKRAEEQWISTLQEQLDGYLQLLAEASTQSSASNCGDCGVEVSAEDDFCRSCGNELDHEDGSMSTETDYGELLEQIYKAEMKHQKQAMNMTYELIQMTSGVTVSRLWKYCPDCGCKDSVVSDRDGSAICQYCHSEWEKVGLLNKKWKATSGVCMGWKKPSKDWEQLGKKKHEKFQNKDVFEKREKRGDDPNVFAEFVG